MAEELSLDAFPIMKSADYIKAFKNKASYQEQTATTDQKVLRLLSSCR